MSDLNKTFAEAKLQGNGCASILPSVYYEDTVLEYIDEDNWVNYIIPRQEGAKQFLRVYFLSDSDLMKSTARKSASNANILLSMTDDQELLEFEYRWRILSDFALPHLFPFISTEYGEFSRITMNVPTSVEDILMLLMNEEMCNFVALIDSDRPSVAVLKSPKVALGVTSNQLGRDPVISDFEEYLPKDIGVIFGDPDSPEFTEVACLCYAIPTNLSQEEEELIHGRFPSIPIPHAV